MPGDTQDDASGARLLNDARTDGAAQIKADGSGPRGLLPPAGQAAVRLLVASVIVAVFILISMVYSGVVVPAHVVTGLQDQIDSLKRENHGLRTELQRSQALGKEYEEKLEGASAEQARSRMQDMQAAIKALEQQIETMRAAEWPPLTQSAQESLYQMLKDMPAQEVWVGYADSGGRALARTFSEVFKRLNWPQKYEILAVLDPEEGLWITPISDFSEQLKDRIARSTGLQFKLFPRRERFPDKIGVIVGYRVPQEDTNETP